MKAIITILLCSLVFAMQAQLNFKHHEWQNNATFYSSLVDPIDYDLDGDLDIISYSTASYRAKILLCYNEDYYFKDCISLEDEIEGQKIKRILYLNNDDKLDYITDDGIMMSNGDDYNFTPSDSPLLSYKLHAEDMNNDGLIDLVPYAKDTSSNIIPIIYNQGNSWQIPEIDPMSFTSINCLIITDLNSDEKKDLIIQDYGAYNNIYLFHQNQLNYNHELTEQFKNATAIDINHDGLLDFVSTSSINSYTGTKMHLHLNTGNPASNFAFQEYEFPDIFYVISSQILPFPINNQYVANNLFFDNYCTIKWVNNKPELELNKSNHKIEALKANMIVMGDHIFHYGQTEYAVDLNSFPTLEIKNSKTIPRAANWSTFENKVIFSAFLSSNTYYSVHKVGESFEVRSNNSDFSYSRQTKTNTYSLDEMERLAFAKYKLNDKRMLYRITETDTIVIDSSDSPSAISCYNVDDDPELEIILISNNKAFLLDNQNGSVVRTQIANNAGSAFRVLPLQKDKAYEFLILDCIIENSKILNINTGEYTLMMDLIPRKPWNVITASNSESNNLSFIPADGVREITKVENIEGDFDTEFYNIDSNVAGIASGDLTNNNVDEIIVGDFSLLKINIYEYANDEYTLNSTIDLSKSHLLDIQCIDIDFDGDLDILVISDVGIDLYENLLINTSTEDAENQASLAIFPNPASGNNITIQNTEQHFHKYKIYNIAGGLIKSGTIQNSNIDIEGIPSGFYKLLLESNTRAESTSIIIER